MSVGMPSVAAQAQSELGQLNRRDVIRLLGGALALPVLSASSFALLREAREQMPASAAGYTLQAVDAHQDATISAIAEWIIPQTDTPGAKATKVNEFIDMMLAEWYSPEEKSSFLQGLADADAQCNAAFGTAFVKGTPSQQRLMMTAWDEEFTKFRESATPFEEKNRFHPPPVSTQFFQTMKRLTLVGYFTSEAGATQVLHYEVVPSRHAACISIPAPVPATASEAK